MVHCDKILADECKNGDGQLLFQSEFYGHRIFVSRPEFFKYSCWKKQTAAEFFKNVFVEKFPS
jgi:hypothetical protein